MKLHRLAHLALLLMAVTMSLAFSGQARSLAQPAAPPSALPSYDYDTTAPGVQGPTSPLVAGADLHVFRGHVVGMGVLVPLAELQALLPAGFAALPSQPGAGTAIVSIAFVYQQRTEVAGGSILGPSSGVFLSANVTNTTLARTETIYLEAVFNDQATIDAHNAVMGPGSFCLGEVDVEIEEAAGMLSFGFELAGCGLRLRASATGSAAMLTHSKSDPQPAPFRFINTGGKAGPAQRASSQASFQTLTAEAANLKIKAPGGILTLPDGSLSIEGLGPNVSLVRWGEVFTRAE